MPLRDHFHSPLADKHSWDEVHGGWPMMIVRDLFDILPVGYTASPNVHLGPMFEVDVSTFGEEAGGPQRASDQDDGAVATAPRPTLTLEADLSESDEYEVRIFDEERGRRLVAAIELVSPSNKDRPESRRAFLAKVEALLNKEVCVSIVDVVSVRQFHLDAELLERQGHSEPRVEQLAPLYAVTLRGRKRAAKPSLLDIWFYPMAMGEPLPTLPIWLSTDVRVLLTLESSYEETCRLLHIR
jgi:hypothetical protein